MARHRFTKEQAAEIRSISLEIFKPCPCGSAEVERCKPEFSADLNFIGNQECHRMASIEPTLRHTEDGSVVTAVGIKKMQMTTKEELLAYEFAFGRAELDEDGNLVALETLRSRL